jgi:hypothetical protein
VLTIIGREGVGTEATEEALLDMEAALVERAMT